MIKISMSIFVTSPFHFHNTIDMNCNIVYQTSDDDIMCDSRCAKKYWAAAHASR